MMRLASTMNVLGETVTTGEVIQLLTRPFFIFSSPETGGTANNFDAAQPNLLSLVFYQDRV
jgi:hypothetical protein